jgi:hypothetical protein
MEASRQFYVLMNLLHPAPAGAPILCSGELAPSASAGEPILCSGEYTLPPPEDRVPGTLRIGRWVGYRFCLEGLERSSSPAWIET